MRPSRLFVLVPMLMIVPVAGATRDPGGDDSRLARVVDAHVRPLLQRGELAGQLLITRHGHVVLERCWGMANAEWGVPVTPATRFNVASVTKPMTVVLAIQSIVGGHMTTRDSIVRWLPGFPRGDSITVGMLLRHRSGIPHELVPDSESTRPFTSRELAERAARRPLDFRPGSEERYSSGGFEVLARVIELAEGQAFDMLLHDRLFTPLGMTASSEADSRTLLPDRASGYVPGVAGIENAPLQDFTSLIGAGSVWSTARDLQRFVDAVAHGRLGPGPQRSFVRDGTLEFNGRTGGFKAWAVWDSVSDVAVIMLSNLATGAPDLLQRDIPRLVAGETPALPTLPASFAAAPDSTSIARWVGRYRLENGTVLEVRARRGTLWSNDWVWRALPDGDWFSPRDYGRVRGVTGADGRIAKLLWEQGGVSYPAPRIGD